MQSDLSKFEDLERKQHFRTIKAEKARQNMIEKLKKTLEIHNKRLLNVSIKQEDTKKLNLKKTQELSSKFRNDFLNLINEQSSRDQQKSSRLYKKYKQSEYGFQNSQNSSVINEKNLIEPEDQLNKINSKIINAEKIYEQMKHARVRCASENREKHNKVLKQKSALFENYTKNKVYGWINKYKKILNCQKSASKKLLEFSLKLKEKHNAIFERAKSNLRNAEENEKKRIQNIEEKSMNKQLISQSILERKGTNNLSHGLENEGKLYEKHKKWKDLLSKNKEKIITRNENKEFIIKQRQSILSYRKELLRIFKKKKQEEISKLQKFKFNSSFIQPYGLSPMSLEFSYCPEANPKYTEEKNEKN